MLELRSFTIMGPFFVVFLVNNFASGKSCGNTGFYPEKKGKSLEHHVIDTMTTDTASLCRITCHLKEECMSYNYQASTGTCEISDSDEHQHSAQLVNKTDHIYVGRENPCYKTSCPHYKVCEPNFKNGIRVCLCPRARDYQDYQDLSRCDEDCIKALGMESGAIPNSAITASSLWGPKNFAYNARLNNNPGHWASVSPFKVGEWLQVDFGKLTVVTGVATQGRPFGAPNYVTSYNLTYRRENERWQSYVHASLNETLPGNTNYYGIVNNTLNPKIMTRYIRIYPKTWFEAITMRVEFYGCG